MKPIRSALALFLMIAMLLSLAACGEQDEREVLAVTILPQRELVAAGW